MAETIIMLRRVEAVVEEDGRANIRVILETSKLEIAANEQALTRDRPTRSSEFDT
jgi:hypothetical protein